MSPSEVAACFSPYRPDDGPLNHLAAKLEDRTFVTDLEPLVAQWPDHYAIEAGERTVRYVIASINRSR